MLKKRGKNFGINFFVDTEAEESDDETHKRVQFWVNTGHVSYNSLKSNTRVCSSTSSSLDTTAYILSNTNITNKAKTMAIVEGAKHHTINRQTAKHMEMTQVIPNEMYIREHKNNTFNDDSYCEQYSQKTSDMSNFLLQPKDTNTGQNVTLGVDNDVYTLPEVVNMDGELINRFKSCYNKSPDEKITCMFDNSQTRNPSIKQTFMFEDNIGIKYHKKLYTGRDSPIDLINMKSSNKCKIFKLKQNLHPALDHEYKYKLSKKYKIKKIRRLNQASTFHKDLINNSNFSILSSGKRIQRKKKPDFNKISKMILDTTETVDTLSVNSNIKDNSVINEMSVEHNGDHCLNTSLPINESTDKTTANCTFNKSIDHLEREFTNVNPVVHLVRLSEDIIARYLELKKAIEILNTADITGLSKFSDKHRDLKKPIRNESKNVIRKSTNVNPVVRLVRLSEDVIARYSGSKKAMEVLNTAGITESSKFSDKYRDLKKPIRNESKNVIRKSTNINPVVRLVRLSEDVIARYSGSRKAMEVLNTADITGSSKFSDKYRDLTKSIRNESKNAIRKSTNVNPVLHLVRLSEDVIARYSGSKKAMEVLNAASMTGSSKFNNKRRDLKEPIRSKKEMESKNYLNSTVNTSIPNIQKYKKSTDTKTNFENFNPVVVLKRLSKSDICKKMQLQNNNMNTFELKKSSVSNNSKSTLDTISPMYKEPTSPQNIKTRKCYTVWIDESFVTSVSSVSTVKVSNKHTFKRETKITEEGYELNKNVTSRPVRSIRTSSSYATGEENDKSNSSSRVHKVLDVVATSLPWSESESDGEDYEKFITSLEVLNKVK
ncbi:unnamed protein product [Xylocopa violacea]|uniref:Uncharacterized protein n=1 Tax=Xylocopa violacea TaxID=135666 RepID=A0ABP1N5B0_XYLVO